MISRDLVENTKMKKPGLDLVTTLESRKGKIEKGNPALGVGLENLVVGLDIEDLGLVAGVCIGDQGDLDLGPEVVIEMLM